jgi:hypothetical protein
MKTSLSRLVSFVSVIFLWQCSAQESTLPPALVADTKPLHTYGDGHDERFYRFIWKYTVNKEGRVYLWDSSGDYLDVYDESGTFLRQFGRKGQGVGELQSVTTGAVDSKGDIWLADLSHSTLKVFSENGEFKLDVRLPQEIARSFIRKMIFDKDDELYLLCFGDRGETTIYRYYVTKGGRCSPVFVEDRRMRASIVFFVPDIALDEDSNLYVTDSFDYCVHIFDKMGNHRIKQFIRGPKKEQIGPMDLNVFDRNFRIMRIPEYKTILGMLSGPSRYFPIIFGINIDHDTTYIWTSARDEISRYIIDIYDKSLNWKGKACYFNLIRENVAEIINKRLYIPSLENYEAEKTRKVGRLGFLNETSCLNVYSILE